MLDAPGLNSSAAVGFGLWRSNNVGKPTEVDTPRGYAGRHRERRERRYNQEAQRWPRGYSLNVRGPTVTVKERVAAFLNGTRGRCFCSECLGRALDIDVASAHRAAVKLSRLSGFRRECRPCSQCGKSRLATAMSPESDTVDAKPVNLAAASGGRVSLPWNPRFADVD